MLTTASKAEERLRAELFKDDAPLEIFALLGNHEQPERVVRVYSNREGQVLRLPLPAAP